MIGAVGESQRKATRAAGLAYLLSTAIVISAEFGIRSHLIVPGNTAETARNILAHEQLFRISILCDLLYCVGIVVLLTALYVVLRAVGPTLALLAAWCRLIYASSWVLMMVNALTALRLLTGPDYLRVFGAERLQALARLYLSGFDVYYVGLLFYGLGATLCFYLWLQSRYIPGALAIGGLISSAWCAACTAAFIVLPDFAKVVNLWWFDSPMAVLELATSFWLLFKGLRPSETAKPRGIHIPERG